MQPSPIWQSSEFFSSNYFQIGQHVVLLHIQVTHTDLLVRLLCSVSLANFLAIICQPISSVGVACGEN